jgi:hypothetical protein
VTIPAQANAPAAAANAIRTTASNPAPRATNDPIGGVARSESSDVIVAVPSSGSAAMPATRGGCAGGRG